MTDRIRVNRRRRLFRLLLWVQGTYYAVTAVWPIVSIRSFQSVTGPKTDHLPTGLEADHWLVMTVAVLILSVAATLLFGAVRDGRAPELAFLAINAAIGLTMIDVVYVARQVIAPIYLADAVVECVLIGLWIVPFRGALADSRTDTPQD